MERKYQHRPPGEKKNFQIGKCGNRFSEKYESECYSEGNLRVYCFIEKPATAVSTYDTGPVSSWVAPKHHEDVSLFQRGKLAKFGPCSLCYEAALHRLAYLSVPSILRVSPSSRRGGVICEGWPKRMFTVYLA